LLLDTNYLILFLTMADVHSKETRSYNMSRIRSKDTRPEMLVRRFLHKNGFRYRLHVKNMPGKPDIVLPKYKTVIFIHGCFWHGHEGCKYYVVPKTRTEWWLNKINGNINNDSTAENNLRAAGWKIIKIWECELKKNSKEDTLNKLVEKLRKIVYY
jgi:DNA mismatch endonuclease (patch repair protein)